MNLLLHWPALLVGCVCVTVGPPSPSPHGNVIVDRRTLELQFVEELTAGSYSALVWFVFLCSLLA